MRIIDHTWYSYLLLVLLKSVQVYDTLAAFHRIIKTAACCLGVRPSHHVVRGSAAETDIPRATASIPLALGHASKTLGVAKLTRPRLLSTAGASGMKRLTRPRLVRPLYWCV